MVVSTLALPDIRMAGQKPIQFATCNLLTYLPLTISFQSKIYRISFSGDFAVFLENKKCFKHKCCHFLLVPSAKWSKCSDVLGKDRCTAYPWNLSYKFGMVKMLLFIQINLFTNSIISTISYLLFSYELVIF